MRSIADQDAWSGGGACWLSAATQSTPSMLRRTPPAPGPARGVECLDEVRRRLARVRNAEPGGLDDGRDELPERVDPGRQARDRGRDLGPELTRRPGVDRG